MLVTVRERAALAAFAAPAAAPTPAASAAAAVARAIAILARAVAMHRLMIVGGVGHLVDLSGVFDGLALAHFGVTRLVDLFGDEYRRYKGRVSMLVPWRK